MITPEEKMGRLPLTLLNLGEESISTSKAVCESVPGKLFGSKAFRKLSGSLRFQVILGVMSPVLNFGCQS
jgi:hypothetical protein